jgi:dihydroxyacetone kinase
MTRLFNDPTRFADELTAGFVAAHRQWVRRVPGGMIRATRSVAPTVAVVTGGGSGHYPAFAGYVGQGLAHGAAMGNLFASPSAQQVYAVARAADRGAGVLFCYGNYAGDVLHFRQAQDRLNDEGVAARTVTVTDDISSAPLDEMHKRRGIAGDVAVLKVAGAAADRGDDLDAVVRVVQRANHRTRSYGVALSGCTLPGASAPLFEVPPGKVAVGVGIHGEPGIDEEDVPAADGLAQMLVAGLLDEVPDDVAQVRGSRLVAILNGLGSVKYEEQFVVYGTVARLLEEVGLEIVEPEVGELVTSFDMAGVSLTLFWLDDELEELWRAPADGPAYRKGNTNPDAAVDPGEIPTLAEATIAQGSDASRTVAAQVVTALDAVRTPLPVAWTAAADAADKAAEGTAQLLPRRGRAWPLAEKSLGTPDAGAVSFALIVRAVGACTGPDPTATERVAR